MFSSDSFKDSLKRVFVKVGLAPWNELGSYINYTSHSRGFIPVALAPAESPKEEQFMLGDAVPEVSVEFERREEAASEDSEDEDDDE